MKSINVQELKALMDSGSDFKRSDIWLNWSCDKLKLQVRSGSFNLTSLFSVIEKCALWIPHIIVEFYTSGVFN